MRTEKITVNDIRAIGKYGKLIATMPSFLSTVSVRNTVCYVNKAYKREDGLIYQTSTDVDTNTITIYTTDKPSKPTKKVKRA